MLSILSIFWLRIAPICLLLFFHVLLDTARLKATYNDYRMVIHPRSFVRQTHGFMVHGNGLSLLPSHVLSKAVLGVSYLVGKYWEIRYMKWKWKCSNHMRNNNSFFFSLVSSWLGCGFNGKWKENHDYKI